MNQKSTKAKTVISADIAQIHALISDDMLSVNQLIETSLSSDVPLINQLGQYIINLCEILYEMVYEMICGVLYDVLHSTC